MSVFGDLADVVRWVAPIVSDANDPKETSRRRAVGLGTQRGAALCGGAAGTGFTTP